MVIAGLADAGVVLIAGADKRSDDGELVHHRRNLGHVLANLDAGDVGLDRLELAADIGRRVGLQVEHVLMRRAAGQVDHDDRLVGGSDARRGLGSQHVRERKPAQRQPADSQEVTSRETVAEPAGTTSAYRQHRRTLLRPSSNYEESGRACTIRELQLAALPNVGIFEFKIRLDVSPVYPPAIPDSAHIWRAGTHRACHCSPVRSRERLSDRWRCRASVQMRRAIRARRGALRRTSPPYRTYRPGAPREDPRCPSPPSGRGSIGPRFMPSGALR